MQTDYERIGEERLRAVVADFIDRVYRDVIIGFFFLRIDKAALIEHEFRFAAAHLGGPKSYGGRTIAEAHRRHPINRGQFRRRLWLLENTLRDHGIEDDIIERWIQHNQLLERVVTDGSECVPTPNN
ncbi:MAG: group 1 truncated hemoglobin [Myxococcales bacterium]|nr:group 1 truncated hemoglobin [Myxococcales bacterium]